MWEGVVAIWVEPHPRIWSCSKGPSICMLLQQKMLVDGSRSCGDMGCRVFQKRVQNYKECCLRIDIPKGNYWIWRIGLFIKVPKFDFQSQFSTSSHPDLSHFFFSLKNANLEAHFYYWHFLITSIVKSLYSLK